MARKSSKTAHVMNLLAGDDSESPKSEAAKENIAASLTTELGGSIKELTVMAQQASIQTQDGPLTPSPISIIDMSSSAPDPVAELIKQRLEEEEGSEEGLLPSEQEMPQDLPSPSSKEEEPRKETFHADTKEGEFKEEAPVEDSPKKEVPKEETFILEAPDSEELIIETPIAEDPIMETPIAEEQKKEDPEAEVPVSEAPESKPLDYEYLNVMEYVVKNRVKDYMEKFDVCLCGRCIADVTALALTNLPPKYIVVEPPSASPLLNFYSNRYSQHIIVELTKACSAVKENPHH